MILSFKLQSLNDGRLYYVPLSAACLKVLYFTWAGEKLRAQLRRLPVKSVSKRLFLCRWGQQVYLPVPGYACDRSLDQLGEECHSRSAEANSSPIYRYSYKHTCGLNGCIHLEVSSFASLEFLIFICVCIQIFSFLICGRISAQHHSGLVDWFLSTIVSTRIRVVPQSVSWNTACIGLNECVPI